MQSVAIRPLTTAAVALMGAGAIAATPVVVPQAAAVSVGILLAAQDITIDMIRHGQSVDNFEGILGTIPPGAALTELGQEQAEAVAPLIDAAFPGGLAGIYASEFIRAQDTAAPLAELLGMDVNILSGLNEINAGWFEGQELNLITQIAYALPTFMWALGHYWVPMLGSSIDPNGVAFNDRVTDAIDAIYNNTVADPENPLADAVFAHAGTISIWTLMNVQNPDFGLVLSQLLDTHNPLDNTGQVVIEGNPTDGWTLVSWGGQEVSATPDLLTGLFVDWRDLNVAPQIATWHILEALQGGDQAEIAAALETGFNDVFAAFAAFPQAVFDTITGALLG
ncbi:histidine phosphatase family protein [Mycolicibacter arupensis]|jgi:broad specificity phosphatase PhoE|uniref:Histidine phosphatase family protein n=1 Tax=Mycolicibacter arupensis TaxID=342002 RepID=A0A5C7XRQ6_9MYCO|nr:histidine phosphatase family protein [Mycolicibacter arupensis]KAA1430040.1 histidine phosphatase family protein [Mycolicibacter arupensis]TXI52245.1 MAG: histidine phosphatase family protein [Mycolicibacter arupensis]